MISFEVDETSDVPLWVQLRNRIAFLINAGELAPGEKLPTVRGLAAEISINYNTVNKAYLSLVSEGYLESVRGRGVFVSDASARMDDDELSQVEAIMDEAIGACRELGMEYTEIEKMFSRHVKRLRYEAERQETGGGRIVEFRDARAQRKAQEA